MLCLISGGSGSGKSEYAEGLITSRKKERKTGELIYLATMLPSGEETKRKIARHQRMREGKGFQTMECFGGLEKLKFSGKELILLECMSNLVADEIYACKNKNPVESIVRGVEKIISSGAELYLVTNEVFSDGLEYDMETLWYIQSLAEINKKLARIADQVIEVCCGIPIIKK